MITMCGAGDAAVSMIEIVSLPSERIESS
jgi:hypothetical protein